ncbi:sulfotransferase domain-containing protein [Phenylobacterium sp.]|uniref:sulfotransferase domain-containing protein n=1 Tax=Phenylobacterium sp. TaxID=1871053 RepID=UPI002732B8C4|nr:sulfotransferase domain-containing protein [Phenylobacterium sp.]MDP3634460.1 sulfotransferase domain-containing protein [Phenylobacterium sp.]
MPRVDFIIPGFQKAGTTALFDHLGDVPGISLSATKEVHFFDDESVDWSSPDYRAYEAQFPVQEGAVVGEATPIYLYWPNALERIATYNPAIRLIILLRDPVERAWSQWRMEIKRGAEREPFAWCIREGRQRLFASEPWGHHREFSYVERGFYGEQLDRLFGVFPREQVLFLKAEDLRTDPNTVLAQVCAFVGAPPPPRTEPRSVHVGQEMGGLDPADAAHLRAIYARDLARLKDLTGISF